MTNSTKGILYGVGVGPGDPDLLTMKACRTMQNAPVIAYITSEEGDSFARHIAAAHIPEDSILLPIPMIMATSHIPGQNAYDKAAIEISAHLDAGRDVAVLCEGDPFMYGSFMYLFIRLSDRYSVDVIPGITSITAGAAALSYPLAGRDDVLSVIPATLADPALTVALASCDTAVIIKLGRHWPRVRRQLSALHLLESARVVSFATLPGQVIEKAVDVGDELPYFSLLMVQKESAHFQELHDEG